METTDKKELSEAEIQAGLHWDYVEKTLQTHCIDQSELDLCGHHYKTAFVHGWKHGQEAMNGSTNS